MPVVVREMPAWQLKTMGVEAEVLFRMPTIWSKQLSFGAVSWFSGIRSASTFSFCRGVAKKAVCENSHRWDQNVGYRVA